MNHLRFEIVRRSWLVNTSNSYTVEVEEGQLMWYVWVIGYGSLAFVKTAYPEITSWQKAIEAYAKKKKINDLFKID